MAREPAAHATKPAEPNKDQQRAAGQDKGDQSKAQGQGQGGGKDDKQAGQTAGGIRMADDRFRFEKHGTKPGKGEAPKQPFTRPWGSQPMNVDVKTGAMTGAPHPEPKPDLEPAYGR